MKPSEFITYAVPDALRLYGAPDFGKRDAFVNNLVFLYHTMKASENLLALAAQHSVGSLQDYFTAHLEEERGHEAWLAEDLMTAGIDVAKTPVPRRAVEMVGSQYYLIHHVDPAGLLGYMALQECFPKSLNVIEKMEELHGKDLCRTLRYHAEHDVDHGADLLKVIDTLPEQSQSIAISSAIQSAHHFGAATQTF